MKPLEHANISVKKWGGKVEDYLKLHTLMDFSKSSVPSMVHRVMFHHSAGIWFMEEVFGAYITNSDDKKVATRDIAEQHVLDDLGFIPTLADWTSTIKEQSWMFAGKAKIILDDEEKDKTIPTLPNIPQPIRPIVKRVRPYDFDPSRVID